ncbi:MAG: flagellin lysine-N-methylase [Ruminiclostridium sp.]|nr:flagellin lysine-N-methylase [Ruminiclostridium sp.]
MDHYYKQPKNYSQFHCIGGDCPDSCCLGWRINWMEDEYDKLSKAGKSEELERLINDSLVETDDKYQSKKVYEVVFSSDGYCPIMDRKTGLCMIQRELGEEYLGVVCTTYPRLYFRKNDVTMRQLQFSCAHVVQLLMSIPDAAKLETVVAHDQKNIDDRALQRESADRVSKARYLKYRFEICDFMSDIFGFDTDFENIMIIGALAAKKISDAAAGGKADTIPEIMKNYKKQFASPEALSSLSGISSNYRIKFAVINNILVQYLGDKHSIIENISAIHDGETFIAENYIKGKENFEKCFGDRKYALKNIALNLFYNIFVGLDPDVNTFMELYSYFTACAGAVQIIAYATGYGGENIEMNFIRSVSDFGRGIIHSKLRANDIMEHIKKLGLVTPAHLAMIIK